jgi:hypothetical protein
VLFWVFAFPLAPFRAGAFMLFLGALNFALLRSHFCDPSFFALILSRSYFRTLNFEEGHLFRIVIDERWTPHREDPGSRKRGIPPLLGEERPRQQQGLEQRSRLAGKVSKISSLLSVPVVFTAINQYSNTVK